MRHDAKGLPGADNIHYRKTQNMLPEDEKGTTATSKLAMLEDNKQSL